MINCNGKTYRLVRGIYVKAVRFLSEFGPVMMVMLLMLTIVAQATKATIPNWVRNVFHSQLSCSHG